MSELKARMKVRIEIPECDAWVNSIYDGAAVVFVGVDKGCPDTVVVPASWCKPILSELALGDIVRHRSGMEGVVIEPDQSGLVIVGITNGVKPWGGGAARWQRDCLTLVRKASYTKVDA